LTLTQKAAICSRAGNQTLRELAAEVGVSHETVRAILRTAGAADVGDGLAVERGRPSP
jgi:predicted ArsR family transcriptional regulator